MRTKLTPGFVKTATAIDGKDRTIFWDETMSGFGLMVTAAGSRSYVVQYRAGRSSRRLTIDGGSRWTRPASKRRWHWLGCQGRRSACRAPRGAGCRQRHPKEHYRGISRPRNQAPPVNRSTPLRSGTPCVPQAWPRPIADIKRSEIVRLLDHVKDTAGPVASHIVPAYLRRVFNWHASRSDDFRSPIIKGMGRQKANDRERILRTTNCGRSGRRRKPLRGRGARLSGSSC